MFMGLQKYTIYLNLTKQNKLLFLYFLSEYFDLVTNSSLCKKKYYFIIKILSFLSINSTFRRII